MYYLKQKPIYWNVISIITAWKSIIRTLDDGITAVLISNEQRSNAAAEGCYSKR